MAIYNSREMNRRASIQVESFKKEDVHFAVGPSHRPLYLACCGYPEFTHRQRRRRRNSRLCIKRPPTGTPMRSLSSEPDICLAAVSPSKTRFRLVTGLRKPPTMEMLPPNSGLARCTQPGGEFPKTRHGQPFGIARLRIRGKRPRNTILASCMRLGEVPRLTTTKRSHGFEKRPTRISLPRKRGFKHTP